MPDAPPHFLIVEANPFIALDLAESIRDCGPADLSTAATPAEAAHLLSGPGRLCAAFVRAPVAAILSSGLDLLVAAAGGRMVVIGTLSGAAIAQERGWLILGEPFTSEMVRVAAVAAGCLRGTD